MASADDIEVDDAPTDINPYFVLDLEPDAGQGQIKAAYRKAALRHHPDKAAPNEKEAAHAKFQEVAFAYAVLSDEKRRRRYDATGSTAESLEGEDGEELDWASFFRAQYANAVTEDKISDFASEYKGSEEEKGHVLVAYERHQGDMSKLYQDVMLSDMVDDEERFRAIIDEAIEAGEVEEYEKYTKESEKAKKSRMKQALQIKNRESKEAKEISSKSKSKKGTSKENGDTGDLAALIQQRQKGRAEGFFDQLEAKYAAQEARAKGKKGGKRASPMEEPPEEAFEKNRSLGNKGEGEATDRPSRNKRAKRA